MLIGVCDLYLALFCIYVANGALQYMGTDVYSSPSGNLVLAKACFAPVFFGFLILIYVGKYFLSCQSSKLAGSYYQCL